MTLTSEQQKALNILQSKNNVFLTGAAGTGKSFVIRHYLKHLPYTPPILASTGVAAVLVGGRTFHSFFGLGIMEGGIEKTVDKATRNPKVTKRLKVEKEIIIDEVSMIHPDAFVAAEWIARIVRGSDEPFGGLRIITVGDFFQLPPIDRNNKQTRWLFQSDLWQQLGFTAFELKTAMRTSDQEFIDVLNLLRHGQCSEQVSSFLNSREAPLRDDFGGTVLFGKRSEVEQFNQRRLNNLSGELIEFPTEFHIPKKSRITREQAINSSPLPETLYLKVGALVMIRKNDLDGKYVNGSLAHVTNISERRIQVQLVSGAHVAIEKEEFSILDGEGMNLCTIINFPLSLGWASTIHKSQGASIDRIHVNLKRLWECGQAYVALSRAKDPNALFIEEWSPGSIRCDQTVRNWYQEMADSFVNQ